MNPKLSFKSITVPVLRHLSLILYVFGFMVMLWLGYFSYANLYQTAINPPSIDQAEIIARRQKVNVELFTSMQEHIAAKQSIDPYAFADIDNPFQN